MQKGVKIESICRIAQQQKELTVSVVVQEVHTTPLGDDGGLHLGSFNTASAGFLKLGVPLAKTSTLVRKWLVAVVARVGTARTRPWSGM